MRKGSMEKSISVLGDLREISAKEGRELMINIDRRMVMETPVDTGAARRNWLASVDQPDNSIIDEDNVDLSTAAMQAIEQGASTFGGAKTYDRLYLQNSLPYIQRLNEGWSRQAPTGFVDKIIAEEVADGNG